MLYESADDWMLSWLQNNFIFFAAKSFKLPEGHSCIWRTKGLFSSIKICIQAVSFKKLCIRDIFFLCSSMNRCCHFIAFLLGTLIKQLTSFDDYLIFSLPSKRRKGLSRSQSIFPVWDIIASHISFQEPSSKTIWEATECGNIISYSVQPTKLEERCLSWKPCDPNVTTAYKWRQDISDFADGYNLVIKEINQSEGCILIAGSLY